MLYIKMDDMQFYAMHLTQLNLINTTLFSSNYYIYFILLEKE